MPIMFWSNAPEFCLYIMLHIKTHGSESRGQEEAACTRVIWPMRSSIQYNKYIKQHTINILYFAWAD